MTGLNIVNLFISIFNAIKPYFINEETKKPNWKFLISVALMITLVFIGVAIAINRHIPPESTEPTHATTVATTAPTTVATTPPVKSANLTQQVFIDDSNETGSSSDIDIGNWVDVFGNYYASSLKFWVMDAPNMANAEHITYHLIEPYSTLSGTIAAEQGCESGSEMIVIIYLDDVEAYRSETITVNTQPVSFSIDISGKSTAMIVCSTSTEHDGYCIVSAKLS